MAHQALTSHCFGWFVADPRCGRDMAGICDIGQFHSITSSAVASNTGGTEMPSAAAVFKLITKSNLSGRRIGKSLGLAPCRIFAT
jgi:hypothetical protein